MARKQRRQPQRTCVACRQVRDKRDLVRIIRSSDGSVKVDLTGKAQGRGAYLCKASACWEKVLAHRGILSSALKTELDETSRTGLEEYAKSLKAEEEIDSSVGR